MEILLSRILKFMNGAIQYNYMYVLARFIVAHYLEMGDYTIERMVEESGFSEAEILDFIGHFGFHNFEDFQVRLQLDYDTRLSQISLRMLNVTPEEFMVHLKVSESKEEMLDHVRDLCEMMFKARRIIIIGSAYPTAIAVDYQTDLITFGKEVITYHHFDTTFKFYEDDLVIVISATGRTLQYGDNLSALVAQGLCDSEILLITQNRNLSKLHNICADEVIQVMGKYDGMMFNHQLMMIFDLFRIVYFKQYYQ